MVKANIVDTTCRFVYKEQMNSTVPFTEFPLGLPITTPSAEIINHILRTNYEFQEKCFISHACCIINLVLQRCLSGLGIDSVLVYGLLRQESTVTPHVWSKIHGQVVDNTFFLGETIERKLRVNKYEEVSVRDASGVYIGDKVTTNLGLNHNINEFEWMLSKPERTISLSKNVPRFHQYINHMTSHLKDKYEVNINFSSTSDYCWGCSRADVPLKTCGRCKVAMFCGRKCQKREWKNHKDYECIPPNCMR